MSELEKAEGYAIDAMTRYVIEHVKSEVGINSIEQHEIEELVSTAVVDFAKRQSAAIVESRKVYGTVSDIQSRLDKLEEDSHPYIKTWPAKELDKAIFGLRSAQKKLEVRLEQLEANAGS